MIEELIKAYEEYILLLEEAERENVVFLHMHGIVCPLEKVKQGEDCRAKIALLKEKLI